MTKNALFRALLLFAILLILSTAGCIHENEEEDAVYWELHVAMGSGVSGYPDSSVTEYDQETVVEYSYALKPGYRDLKVTYNDVEVLASGTITVKSGINYLFAQSNKILDIRGKWTGHQYYLFYNFYLEVSFNGGLFAGESKGTTDQIEIYQGRGDYTLSSDEKKIDFTLTFTALGITFHFKGSIDGNNKMSGLYYTNPPQWAGKWELQR